MSEEGFVLQHMCSGTWRKGQSFLMGVETKVAGGLLRGAVQKLHALDVYYVVLMSRLALGCALRFIRSSTSQRKRRQN